jgi:hypothetical protein
MQAGDHVAEIVECAGGNDLRVSVSHHDDAYNKAHDQSAKRLKTVKPAKQWELLFVSVL